MFEIRTATGCRSCAMCNAATYKNQGKDQVTIYELKIGCMVNALCAECLHKLANQINEQIEL